MKRQIHKLTHNIFQILRSVVAILTLILPSSFARAEAGDDKGLPTAYLMGDASYSVSRSDVIVGTDFGAATNYEMGWLTSFAEWR